MGSTANMILHLSNAQCLYLNLYHLTDVSLVFMSGLIDNEVPVHSFATNFEPKPVVIFCGPFCYHRMTVL
jgi:hypothetical protein